MRDRAGPPVAAVTPACLSRARWARVPAPPSQAAAKTAG